MGGGKSLLAAGLLATVLVVPAGLYLFDSPTPEIDAGLRRHAPILIDGDSEFKRQNGVVSGSGIPGDPYVIEGWDISTTSASGIEIRNTRAHFVIRDVLVHDGASPWFAVALTNVSFGRVENVTTSNGWAAALWISESHAVNVTASRFVQSGTGLQLHASDFVAVERSDFSSNEVGIASNFTTNSRIANGTIVGNRVFGLFLGSSSWTTIEGNLVHANGNTGILLGGVVDVTVSRNEVFNSSDAGLYALGSSRATILGNTFGGNRGVGLRLELSEEARVAHNRFFGNGIQAQDASGPQNRWDDGYPRGGNFWSDYGGVDRCSGPAQDLCPDPDGIGDTRYVIDADSVDRYPLMEPDGGGRVAPLAFFVARHDRMTVTFDASRSEPRDGVPIVRYVWDFGDGTSAEGLAVVHPYAQPGRYVARLLVVDAEGRGGNATRFVSPSDSTVDVLVDSMFEANCPYGDYWSLRTASYGSVILQDAPPCSDFEPWVLYTSTPETNPSTIHGLYRLDARVRNFYGYSVQEPVLFPILDPNASVDPSSGLRFNLSFEYLGPRLIESLRGTPYEVGAAFSDGFGYLLRGDVTMDFATSRRIFGVDAATPADARAWWAANTAFARIEGPAEVQFRAFLEAQGNGPYDIYNAFEWFFQADITDLNASVAADGTTNVRLFLDGWGLDVLLARWFYWGNASYADAVNQPFETAFPRGWMPMERCMCESATIQGTIQQSLNLDFEAVATYHLRAWAAPGPDGRLGTSDDGPRWVFEPQLSDYVPRHLSGYPNSELRWYEGLTRIHATPGSYAYGTSHEYIDVPARWKLDPGSSLTLVLPRSDVTWYDPIRSTWDPVARIGRYATFRDAMTLGEVRPGGDYYLWDPLGKVLSMAGTHDWGTRSLPLEGAPWIEFAPEGAPPPPPPNTPPTAVFSVSPGIGNVTTVFTADASASFDAEDPPDLLEVRWDWEDDGVWDTPYARVKVAQHQYGRPSNYTIRLEVRDTAGLISTTTREVLVLEDGAGAWTPLAPFPTARDAYGAAEVEGILYYAAGYSFGVDTTVLEAYDPARDAWTPRAPIPGAPRSFAAAVSDGRYLYLVGGRPAEIVGRELWRYDPQADAWNALAPMPTARATSYMAAYADGRIYVVGGRTTYWPIGDALSAFEVYDIATDRWSPGPPLPEARAEATAVARTGRLFVFGGHDAIGAIRDTTFIYDLAAARWSVGPALPEPRWIALSGPCGEAIHVIGGATRDVVTATNFVLDTGTMSWSSAAPIPRPTIAVQAVAYASRIHVVAGGMFAPGGPAAHLAFECPIPEVPGRLFVRTSLDLHLEAFVPGTILVDGVPRDVGALYGLPVVPGRHRIRFSDVPGLGTPAEVVVEVRAGESLEVLGTYVAFGRLRVRTDPALPATIYVDDVPRNDWALDLALPAGVYAVSFGAVAGYQRPAAVTVRVAPEATTEVVGAYVRDGVSPGPDPASHGLLRVITRADDGTVGVPTRISVDGLVRDEWGLAWLKIPPGARLIEFSDVPGLGTPAPQWVSVEPGRATEVQGIFEVHGYLRVRTEPPTPATVFVDGVARNEWGAWLDVRPGVHEVSFGSVTGLVTPPPRAVSVVAGELAETIGMFDIGRPPVASFSVLSVDSLNRTVVVDASASSDPNGDIVQYAWAWGDGTSGAGPIEQHTYAADGDYTIVLVVVDATGLNSTASRTVSVVRPPLSPIASFTVSRSRLRVDVDASASSDPNGDIVSYAWDWGDGAASGPSADPRANRTYAAEGSYRITLTVTDSGGLRGTATRDVSVALTTLDYRFYDFFNVPFGEWWDYRQALYGDSPIGAECFNATAIMNGICRPSDPSVPDVATWPYTNWYPLLGAGPWSHPDANPFIYAPYRMHVVGEAVTGYTIAEPVFLPVLNPSAPAGTRLEFDWRMTHLDTALLQVLQAQGCPVDPFGADGFQLRSRIELTMDLPQSRRLFGVVATDVVSARAWWTANTEPDCATLGVGERALQDWFVEMGGSLATMGKYDIANAFFWFYQPFYTQVSARVDSDGTTHVSIDHVAWGTEVLLARMFYWGNSSYRENYLDSRKAEGWWGMEVPWFEDFWYIGRFNARSVTFALTTAIQYHFRHDCLPGPNGLFDRVDDVPVWTWGPILGDQTNDFTARHLASELDRYPSPPYSYVHCAPGSSSYGRTRPFDYVPIAWNLKEGERWAFVFPLSKVVFYDPNRTLVPADPKRGYVPVFDYLALPTTNPPDYGLVGIDPQGLIWFVEGPASTGGPSGWSGPDGVTGTADDAYAFEPWGAIRFRPFENNLSAPPGRAIESETSGRRAVGGERDATPRPSSRRIEA
jgi:parallel beta-helix repeat protein